MITTIPINDELSQKMTDEIVNVVAPEQIILFGSQATGQAGPHSDIDFLIIQEQPFGVDHNRLDKMTKVWRALAKFGVPTDVLLYSQEEVEAWKDSKNHITQGH